MFKEVQMVKKLALITIALLVVYTAVSIAIANNGMSIIINGHELTGPLQGFLDLGEVIIATVVLFCVGILLAFVFTGVGLILVGVFAFVMIVLAAVLLPFIIPLLIPLFILWMFCCIVKSIAKA